MKYTDPTGCWSVTLGVGKVLAARVQFGINDGKFEYKFRVGIGAGVTAKVNLENERFTTDQSKAGVYVEGHIEGSVGTYSLGVASEIGAEDSYNGDTYTSTDILSSASLSISDGSGITASLDFEKDESPIINYSQNSEIGADAMFILGVGGESAIDNDSSKSTNIESSMERYYEHH